KAVSRIWKEIGWIEDIEKAESLEANLEACHSLVAEINSEAECLVMSTRGDLRYQKEEIPFSGIMGVTTSLIARKQGLASRLTAHKIALEAQEGALVSGLTFFEQGYYDRLGFGNGGYVNFISFDPKKLKIKVKARVPSRISIKDWEAVHQSRLDRMRSHGTLNFYANGISKADLIYGINHENAFGLGYFDGPKGELTHHFFASADSVGKGPYHIWWMSYQNYEQFLELMALIRGLGDQVMKVRMTEPPKIQLQDLIDQPFRQRILSKHSSLSAGNEADAIWQMRINDLPAVMEKTLLNMEDTRFNLELSDPIDSFLDDDLKWHGVAGQYIVTLGNNSGAEKGFDADLPVMQASVNAFTRFWLGVRPASGLAVTDDLKAPQELLEELDQLQLPTPNPNWPF
ncbi:MAG: GNAT family N-acetyltransferase, partial [Anaerolineaceae bacterium]|nr:GNAT family N-acetyltransferase [Anaerolineaceae bacterium]